MIVGHALLAFAISVALVGRFGRSSRVLGFGALAAAFAAIPDVDVAYGVVGAVETLVSSGPVIESFWAAGLLAHRGVTHSLVVGAVAALAVGFLATEEPGFPEIAVGGCLLAGIIAVGSFGGPLAAISAAVFVILGVAIARAASTGSTLSQSR